MDQDKKEALDSEKNEDAPEQKEPFLFSHGFGMITIISLTAYSPAASAGSAVFGPCGTHYT